ncbi:GlxA family transcriptional regulator [Noviherbaspirillum sp.]|uniref:GlxA family transcriptional regulator n=1 Tax=Noviherbaspirillum sp. TaxID=1926288 RepID=UPI002D6360A9|nr:GlxA family transcriptional regulator [Noviherbaspirillum sp.]HZW19745.1 GlxA family transcriptional regulator [Noviherbaspirillum sp.]
MRIAVLAFPGVQMLDVVGPADVFHEAVRQAGTPGAYKLEIVSTVNGPIRASNGMRFYPDSTIDTIEPGIDTLLVAGGPSMQSVEDDQRLTGWLQEQARHVRRLGSVCSGAFILAKSGVLDGRRVTTHWNSSARLARSFPKVKVEADQIYVRDGSIYTSAGVTAGMDLALALVEEDFGRGVALKVAREFVMFLKRPGGQAQFSAHLAAQTAEKSVIRDVQVWILENLDQPLTVDQLAAHAGMSTRNFSRIFKHEAQTTPADYVEMARIDAARRLLEETNTPLKRVAAWCGFGDPNGLRRAFMRRLGVSPADYRRRFQDAA